VVDSYIEGRTFGILGEPRVNVLLVNLALDRQFGRPASLASKTMTYVKH
jgi:K+-transporting ATPase ATPase C chain